MKDEFVFKIIIVWDTNVGKTQILNVFTDKFEEKSGTTVGVDLKIYEIKDEVKNQRIIFQIWDTAGEEKYKSIVSQYYKKISGAIIVYDITNKKSFENVDIWFEQLQKNIEIILVRNKQDLKERVIQYKEGKSKAEKYKIIFYEVSAITNRNIKEVFSCLFENIIKKHTNTEDEDNFEIYKSGDNFQICKSEHMEIKYKRSFKSIGCC